MAAVNPPRGMRDFLPHEKARRERVLTIIRDCYRAHGFDEIETPVMEEYDRLHSGIGGDNEKLAFAVLKRGLDAEAIAAAATDPAALSDLGLRYDLTVPLARFYASHRAELPGVFRSIQIAPAWRAERPQKGRYRQFLQCDIDVIGDATPRAEAELVTATLDALSALGLVGATVRVNDRRVLDALLDGFGFAVEARPGVLITIDKLDKIGADGVVAQLHSHGHDPAAVDAFARFLANAEAPRSVGDGEISRILPTGTPSATADTLTELLQTLIDTCGANGALVFDPFLVRGMGYYTGTIFEITHPEVSYSLAGGGRYDGMIGRFLREDVPAVGFSLGFERIIDLLGEVQDSRPPAVVLVHDADVPVAELIAAKAKLIADGTRVRLETRPKNLRAVLERAAADGYTAFAAISPGMSVADLELKPLN